jgi:RNA polymerase sigma-70 factor (ECF subfamily)
MELTEPDANLVAIAVPIREPEMELFEAVRGGDERAFEELVYRFKDRMFNYVLRMVRHRDLAEDLTQEVFVRVYLAVRKVKSGRSLIPWMYRIANNICIDEHRRRRLEKALVTSLDEPLQTATGEVATEVADESSSPERIAKRNELSRLVLEAIDRLPPKMRSVILLFDMEGLSYEQVAEAVECPVGTVKSRLFNARLQLREQLSAYITGVQTPAE